MRMDIVDEQLDTLGKSFLGLTIGCARCHDHKFDPIPTQDYYALAGVFASCKMVNRTPGGEVEKADKQEQMSAQTLHVVEDGEVQNLNIFIRGNVDRKGPMVPPHEGIWQESRGEGMVP